MLSHLFEKFSRTFLSKFQSSFNSSFLFLFYQFYFALHFDIDLIYFYNKEFLFAQRNFTNTNIFKNLNKRLKNYKIFFKNRNFYKVLNEILSNSKKFNKLNKINFNFIKIK